jgi:hypothetical protein
MTASITRDIFLLSDLSTSNSLVDRQIPDLLFLSSHQPKKEITMTTHHVFLNTAYPDELALGRAEGVRPDEAYPVDLSASAAGLPLWRVDLNDQEPVFTTDLADAEAAMLSSRVHRVSQVEIVSR